MDRIFKTTFLGLLGLYFFMIVLLFAGDVSYISFANFKEAIRTPEIRYAVKLSLITSFITAILSLIVSIPAAYALVRWKFFGSNFIDAVLDLPIIMPPLVIGISLLVFYQTGFGNILKTHGLDLVYTIPGIVVAQFIIACAFCLKTIKTAFEGMDFRLEDVAKTLGCNSWQAFVRITLPLAKKGIVAAGIIAWARAIGEFGPVLVFCGSTRFKTEVLPTTIFLELSIGRIESALAVSLLLVGFSLISLMALRLLVKRGIL
ncbi:MAG: hypothetical protein A2231_09710 [Candidatus Firestonebacteria bacterium RIFOXYA2_FULL_40_8]|nr:MAG: hypothetical protein A2231_09710 [Candidatus Firestonebacteria bacterium RIFOXYA2_FULL_40_8]